MDVLVCCGGSYVSGMQIAALSIMEGLKERGHTVHCVANAWSDGDFPGRLEQAGIPYEELHLGKVSASLSPKHLWWSLDALAHLPRARSRYQRLLDQFSPPLVLFYGFDIPALLFGMHDDIPVAFHVQELPEGSRKLRFVLRRHPSALYIAVSEYIADRLRTLGVFREKIKVVHNGVDPASVVSGRPPPARKEEDEAGPIRIGIVGQVGAWKGHDDLIEALSVLRSELGESAFECHVYGTGDKEYERALKRKAERINIAKCVQWHGFVKDIASIYEGLDVVVVPSRHEEPFGLVAAEAGLWGLPVIVTECGGLPEIVVDEETGFIVEPESPRQIADALLTLIHSPSLRGKMGERAKKRVQANFTSKNMVDGVEQSLLSHLDLCHAESP